MALYSTHTLMHRCPRVRSLNMFLAYAVDLRIRVFIHHQGSRSFLSTLPQHPFFILSSMEWSRQSLSYWFLPAVSATNSKFFTGKAGVPECRTIVIRIVGLDMWAIWIHAGRPSFTDVNWHPIWIFANNPRPWSSYRLLHTVVLNLRSRSLKRSVNSDLENNSTWNVVWETTNQKEERRH